MDRNNVKEDSKNAEKLQNANQQQAEVTNGKQKHCMKENQNEKKQNDNRHKIL